MADAATPSDSNLATPNGAGEDVANDDATARTVVGGMAADVDATIASRDGTRAETGTHDPTALPPDFGRYRIERRLGHGAMGEVYLAHDTQLDRQVALKVPVFAPGASPSLAERFEREARAAANLNHPNICAIHDVGEHDGRRFISMAYIDGRPLSDYTESGTRLPFRQIARTVRRIALAIAEAHEKGIVHRDIKPANVMIDQRNEPIVMDFGLASNLDDEESRLTQEGAVVGTPAYMAPEQVDGSRKLGPGSDIYALGVVLYEMLSGQRPFTGNIHSMIGQILHTEPTPVEEVRKDVPAPLAAICRRAMAKKLDERYETMRAFAKDLSAYLKGEGVSVTAETPVEPPSPAKRRRKKPVPAPETEPDWPPPATQRMPPKTRNKSRNRGRKSGAGFPVGILVGGSVFGLALVLGGVLVFRVLNTEPKSELADANQDDAPQDDAPDNGGPNGNRPNENGPGNVRPDNVGFGPDDRPKDRPRNRDDRGPKPLPRRNDPDDPNRPGGGPFRPEPFFTRSDRNQDGYLDGSEIPGHVIDRADKNGDRRLDLQEIRQGLKQRADLLGPPKPGETQPPFPRLPRLPGRRPQ